MRARPAALAFVLAAGMGWSLARADTPDQLPQETLDDMGAGRHPMTTRDRWISNHLRQELERDPLTHDSPIRASVRNQVVTLSGPVPSLDARDRALHLAVRTLGVNQVVDQLTIRPR
jgi:osmotically-inducible protein OsmY